LLLLHPRLRRLDAHLVCVVHDEVLVEAREDDAERVATVLKATMLEAFSLTFPNAPVNGAVTIGAGYSWADTKL
jgi:DNA polymerase-1